MNNSMFLGMSAPISVDPSEVFGCSVSFRNTGDTDWIPGRHRLGSQHPQDNKIWGFNRVELPRVVPRATDVTFNFNCTAPGSGEHPFSWRMVEDGVAWFGEVGRVDITVKPAIRLRPPFWWTDGGTGYDQG